MSDAFKRLTAGAQSCYLAMALEAAGRIDFSFPLHIAKKFGISNSSLRRHIEELESAGFIEVVERNANSRTANAYRFAFGWKMKPP